MALEFDERISEADIRNAIAGAKSSVNSCKNALTSALAFAVKVTAAEMTRLDLTTAQKTQAGEFKQKAQAIYDAIVAEGF